jgi:ssDNA-binding Zn-finger/Zn-ribbon topoisomerase 1
MKRCSDCGNEMKRFKGYDKSTWWVCSVCPCWEHRGASVMKDFILSLLCIGIIFTLYCAIKYF